MSDGIDISSALSALSGGDAAAKLSSLLGDGDLSSKLSDVLNDGDFSSKLSGILKDGDLSSKLAGMLNGADLSSLLSSLSPPSSGDGANSESKGSKATGAAAALPSIVASLANGGDARSAQRRALLSALRPFVSDRRKKAIDALVGIEKLTAVLPGVK